MVVGDERKRIRQVQKEREDMAWEVAHIFRNCLIVIGRFPRSLKKVLLDLNLRRWAEIIVEEVEKGERALDDWIHAIENGEVEPKK